jgi:hypothetical protein
MPPCSIREREVDSIYAPVVTDEAELLVFDLA